MKLKFKGERATTFSSQPAGVTFQVRPGQEVEVDAGFAYLTDDPQFEVLDSAPGVSGEAETKPAKSKSKT